MTVEMISGVSSMLFGGEGMFLTKAVGPGRVWVQTMPVARMALALMSALPVTKE